MQTLTIQQVAQQTGLSVHTLRYYERNGLLEPVNRASSGHRRYSADDLSRIEFLTRLRATGMPIRQMQEFAQLFRERPDAIAERRAILEAHKQYVQEHINELARNLSVIEWKIDYYKGLEARQQNNTIDSYSNYSGVGYSKTGYSETNDRQDCLSPEHSLHIKNPSSVNAEVTVAPTLNETHAINHVNAKQYQTITDLRSES